MSKKKINKNPTKETAKKVKPQNTKKIKKNEETKELISKVENKDLTNLITELETKKNKTKKVNTKENVKRTKQTNNKKQKLKEELQQNNKEKETKTIKKYKLNKIKVIKFILILILSCIFIYSITMLILNQIEMYNNKKDSEKLIKEVIKPPKIEQETNDEKEEEEIILNPEDVRVDMEKLLRTNEDTVGWMMFNKMLINNPVVHSYDNDYYLHHNFYKKNSELGTIFMDYRNKSFDDRNVVLFGHASIDNTMFGSLKDVFKTGFFNRENADIIYFYDTNNNLLKYQIFSYYTIEKEEYYITTKFKSDEEFQNFLNTIKERSFVNRGITVTTNDKIITLSTCAGSRGTSKRRVIHAKRI
jgi:sortase B